MDHAMALASVFKLKRSPYDFISEEDGDGEEKGVDRRIVLDGIKVVIFFYYH
jgi:hypothetical protein